jgi:hypothetical protein
MLKKSHMIALSLGIGLTSSSASAQNTRLADILRPQTLDTQIAWLEKQIGPAKTIYGKDRSYIFGGCTLGVHLNPDNSIANLGLQKLSPSCTFNTEAIGLKGPAHLLRFNDLTAHMAWTVDALCFMNCGNAADPVYVLQGDGPRVVQFLEYKAEISSAAAGKSGEAFASELLSKIPVHRRDDLMEKPVLEVMAQAPFNALWFKHLGAKRLESLYFGYRLTNP